MHTLLFIEFVVLLVDCSTSFRKFNETNNGVIQLAIHDCGCKCGLYIIYWKFEVDMGILALRN